MTGTVHTPTFTSDQAIATKHALEARADALEAHVVDLPWIADILTSDLRDNLGAQLALLTAMGYPPEDHRRRKVAARLAELDG